MSQFLSSSDGLAFADPARQLGAAAVLGIAGIFFLLPRPSGRSVALGTFLSLAAATVGVTFLTTAFGQPSQDALNDFIFWFFSGGAVLFGTLLVVQSNPARGAIAFAFVILCSCGLFLMLAAPFLAAAVIIVYAGAIIVTFLFVLMLSHAAGVSNENDRSREPLLGALAGFAFAGLVLFALWLGSPSAPRLDPVNGELLPEYPLPAPPLTREERLDLKTAIDALELAAAANDEKDIETHFKEAATSLTRVFGYSVGENQNTDKVRRKTMFERLRSDPIDRGTIDPRVRSILDRANALNARKKAIEDAMEMILFGGKVESVRTDLRAFRDELILFSGQGLLPARNVAAIGSTLYSDHLVAVEMAGTLLLIATIGAVAIARRKGRVV